MTATGLFAVVMIGLQGLAAIELIVVTRPFSAMISGLKAFVIRYGP